MIVNKYLVETLVYHLIDTRCCRKSKNNATPITNHARNYSWNKLSKCFNQNTVWFNFVLFAYCSIRQGHWNKGYCRIRFQIYLYYTEWFRLITGIKKKKKTTKVKYLQGYYNSVIYRAVRNTKLSNNNIGTWGCNQLIVKNISCEYEV